MYSRNDRLFWHASVHAKRPRAWTLTEHDNKKLATAAQMWRANELGLVELRDAPGPPIENAVLKEVLGEAARLGLWSPARGVRGPVRSG